MEPNLGIKNYLAEIGRRGGIRRRRTLSTEESKGMLRVREARRAFKKFYSMCFWSFDPELVITQNEVAWVAEQLRKNGNRKAWELAAKLCQ
ncbi:MAG: hypothetical protein KDD62_05630 [Bdellovibrionales bacterium]|nr:hypothetical protein [Bdellovibrionales bacterium]